MEDDQKELRPKNGRRGKRCQVTHGGTEETYTVRVSVEVRERKRQGRRSYGRSEEKCPEEEKCSTIKHLGNN